MRSKPQDFETKTSKFVKYEKKPQREKEGKNNKTFLPNSTYQRQNIRIC